MNSPLPFDEDLNILFVSHDAARAGSQILLLDIMEWIKQHTRIRFKILLIRGGVLLDRFRDLADCLVVEEIRQKELIAAEIRKFTGDAITLVYANTVVSGRILEGLRYLNCPVVTHVHELEKSIKRFAGPEVMAKTIAFTDKYIAASPQVKENLVINHGIDAADIQVVNAFIKPQGAPPAETARMNARTSLGLPSDKKLVFGCGTLDWRKGADIFVELASWIKKNTTEKFHFYWIGPGGTDNYIDPGMEKSGPLKTFKQYLNELDVADTVSFLGERQNPRAFFQAGDIFALPSREDPFPLVCLEAANCGLPVVCFDGVGGMPDFVEDDCGFVVPYPKVEEMAGKIARLMREPELCRKLGNNGYGKLMDRHVVGIAVPHILNIISGNFLRRKDDVRGSTYQHKAAIGDTHNMTGSKINSGESPVTRPGVTENYSTQNRQASVQEERRNTADFDDPEAVRAIAFYLPQYHAIPENDEWWGKGFTEWNKVVRATPLFAGHYQPHLPTDLGFYDLRVPEVRAEQAALARRYGISGFCYHYYWFGGKRLLERPFEEVLNSGEPDFPFCLCWANENWTRRWDGMDQDILIAQKHSPEDDIAFIHSIIPAFRDPRYIRIHGRPLLLVYQPGLLPNASATAARWRKECEAEGVGNPYLCMIQSASSADPRLINFDAAVEFPPRNISISLRPTFPFKGKLGNYEELIETALRRPTPPFTWFRGVVPSWDNTPRRGEAGLVYHGSRPQLYDHWLSSIVQWTQENRAPGERLVFINAWNEWGEGCHLEPDDYFGHGYLEATRAVLQKQNSSSKGRLTADQIMLDAVAHLQAGRFKEAETLYQQVLVQQPNHPGALHVLGLLKYQNGDLQRALELIERAIAAKPDFAEAYKNAANIYAELDQLDNAINNYRQAIAITPDLVEAHVNLGMVYQTLQRPDEARRHYQIALEIKPDLDEVRGKLAEVTLSP